MKLKMMVAAFIVFSLLWHGVDCFSWMPITNLPVLTHSKRLAPFANVHSRHSGNLFAGQVVRMAMSSEGKAARTVVEGPFEGQFGLWFVDSHDAQVVLRVLR
jgi:hypothetical protein